MFFTDKLPCLFSIALAFRSITASRYGRKLLPVADRTASSTLLRPTDRHWQRAASGKQGRSSTRSAICSKRARLLYAIMALTSSERLIQQPKEYWRCTDRFQSDAPAKRQPGEADVKAGK